MRIKRNYNKYMDIEFDQAKDKANLEKHGMSLADAASIEWETSIVWMDERSNYGESRMCGIGYIGNRLYCVAFVDRGEVRRIISLRKANSREVKRYAET
jgi:uncharacterized DUF497 family protein